jgi:polysaccharide biosynthesis transport protein
MRDNTAIKRKKTQNRQISDFTAQDLLKIIFIRKWLILSILVIVVGTTVYYVQTIPPTYQSSLTMMRELSSSEMIGVGVMNPMYNRIEPGQLTMIKGYTALQEISAKIKKEYGYTDSDISLSAIANGISISVDEEMGNTITIAVTANTPEYAQAIANVSAEVFKDRMDELKKANLSQGTDFLKQQMDLMEQKMQDSEQALNDFRDQEGIVAKLSDTTSSGLLGKLGDLQSQAIQVENDIELNKTQLKTFEELIAEKKKYAQTSSAPEKTIQLDQLRERLITLQLDLNAKLETLTEKDPEVVTLRKRIVATETQLKTGFSDLMKEPGTTSLDPIAELQSLTQKYVSQTVELKGLEGKGRLINERLKKFRDEHPEIATKQVELIRLERQSRLNEQSYTSLAGKYQDMRLMEQMKGAGLKILDKAPLPRSPIAPKKKMIISFSIIAGLFSGIMLALFLEYISDSIKTKEDIERFLELPVLGIITPLGPFNVPASAIRKRENPALAMENKKASTELNNIQEIHGSKRKSDKDVH